MASAWFSSFSSGQPQRPSSPRPYMDNGRCLLWASLHPCVYCRPGLQEVCSAPVLEPEEVRSPGCLPPCPTSWCWRHHPLSGHGVGATLVCRGLRGQVARMVWRPSRRCESQGGIFLCYTKSHISPLPVNAGLWPFVATALNIFSTWICSRSRGSPTRIWPPPVIFFLFPPK